ncbi:hypothetical protein CPB97_003368 [Podila verticillata]|nr:hypothetical protein CPB97_003368 [Podila verticillata]
MPQAPQYTRQQRSSMVAGMAQNPVRTALVEQGEALAAAPVPVFYYANGQFDGSATNAAEARYAQQIATNIAMTNILGNNNNDGDHQRNLRNNFDTYHTATSHVPPRCVPGHVHGRHGKDQIDLQRALGVVGL